MRSHLSKGEQETARLPVTHNVAIAIKSALARLDGAAYRPILRAALKRFDVFASAMAAAERIRSKCVLTLGGANYEPEAPRGACIT